MTAFIIGGLSAIALIIIAYAAIVVWSERSMRRDFEGTTGISTPEQKERGL